MSRKSRSYEGDVKKGVAQISKLLVIKEEIKTG